MKGKKSRIKNLKEALAAYTTTLEDKEGDVLINSDARKKVQSYAGVYSSSDSKIFGIQVSF